MGTEFEGDEGEEKDKRGGEDEPESKIPGIAGVLSIVGGTESEETAHRVLHAYNGNIPTSGEEKPPELRTAAAENGSEEETEGGGRDLDSMT
uniref:Uncharacterized protein n=1 Tax=Chromera velia CCMP2878 TaxID=1169474 RepID=A0A0G4H7Q8_9ALVE|eukprot:Cvel_25026.t1-p1 / transcript=Cvel_25026.t1 / gene=Cvel_25026 / organism=Chromera_velia_CCMP2878 / gene_product=hypothetical protein / transcript_product=hypothetical protein / location=Cvel_scaffold2776:23531-23803(+) / protein_length=91 / sequence_SO=supercontig / SO=protein_coding / is_pseudo=false